MGRRSGRLDRSSRGGFGEPGRAAQFQLALTQGLLIVGPKGGVVTTATLRDATNWDQLVNGLDLAGLVRHGLRRRTALTWMADSGVPLYVLQRVAGHTRTPRSLPGYLHRIWPLWRRLEARFRPGEG